MIFVFATPFSVTVNTRVNGISIHSYRVDWMDKQSCSGCAGTTDNEKRFLRIEIKITSPAKGIIPR